MEKGPKETYIELRILRIKRRTGRGLPRILKQVFKHAVLCCGGGIRGVGVGGRWCPHCCCHCGPLLLLLLL